MEKNNDIFEFNILKDFLYEDQTLNLTAEDEKRKMKVQERFHDFLVYLIGR